MRFDDQARGEVLELHGGGGFVLLWGVSEAGLEGGGVGKRGFGGGERVGTNDFLTAGPAAFYEGL